MGVPEQIDIHGAKGGSSSPKTPIEAADSLRSTNLAKILIAVGEGEFEGTPTARDIYLDNTPIEDASGNVNFPNVKWEWRTGSVEQAYIPGIPSVENETTVNVELRSDTTWVRSLTNTQLSAVRVRLAWPALQQQDDSGNVGGYRIEYAVDIATDGGAYQQVLDEAVDGKTTTRYERSRRIDLPVASSGWQIRVRRITPNQNTNKIADTMLVAGYTEVIDAKLRYPNTALLYIEFDAEQFTNIPAVTIDCRARKWQVPSNYDPLARTYSGVWDGSFKLAWTNNPAWVTFGICTTDRFGLGKRIKPWMVDKWELYRIAQYCDQLVPDGAGGEEPRFLCDMNLQGKAEAWTLLRDISAIYRGMTYWAQGQLVMQADMPRAQDFDYVFTRANVIDGKFSYGSASSQTRYTRAIVSYDNPANNYDTDVTAFADPVLQRRFGDKPVEISAIGCTRASEAQRRGKWAVMSNNQDRTISFKTGMEGAIPLPGYIIPVADSLLAGREIGGRISAATGRVVTLDRDTQAKVGDRLIINLPSGNAQGRTVQDVAGREVTVTTAYSETPTPQLQWALHADDLAIPLYRVLSTKRTTDGNYEINALQYEPSKFGYIDTGARLEERSISVIPISVVSAPASVTLTSNSAIDQGIAVTTMTIAWPAVNGAVSYDVEWRKDNGNWIRVQRTGTTSVDITGIYSGAYLARVRAVSAYDISSIWRTSNLTQLNGKEGLPPAVTSLTTESLIFGIGIKWTFPSGAEDTQRTEIWYGEAPKLESATKLADLPYPQTDYTMQGLRAGQQFFFWARLVDRTGNIGPWFPVGDSVVGGQASADADDILDYLAGQITESELGKELLGEIGKIGGEGPGSVNERLGEVRGELTEVQTRLVEQITAVNNTVAEVQGELQTQIDQIADLADSMPYKDDQSYTSGQGVLGADGVIYQATKNVPANTPPPNADFWLNVGQAVQTASGLAVRVSTSEQKITSIEGVNAAQSEQITGLKTSLDGKADSSVVQSLSSRVSTAEGTISSQGAAITGLNNSLTSTNQNVIAAQNAVNAANTLAGGKGKVIVQSSVPAAADQLAQNLWIDTSNNANTPKRWTGSAWAAVTDKAATDAAAAASTALAQVATKAEAATVQALTNTVTQQGNTLSANGSAITQINTNLSSVGSQNMVYNPSFDKASVLPGVADGWTFDSAGGSRTPSMMASTLVPGGSVQRLDMTGLSATVWNRIQQSKLILVSPGSYAASVFIRATAGLQIKIQVVGFKADDSVSTVWQPGLIPADGNWQRLGIAVNPASDTVKLYVAAVVYGTASLSSGFIELDNAQFQTGSVATGWQDNADVVASDLLAQASATTALNSRVTQNENGLTSIGGQITQLNNNLGQMGGDNMLLNSSFEVLAADGTRPQYWRRDYNSGAPPVLTQVDSPLPSSMKALRVSKSALANGDYIGITFGSEEGPRAKVVAGQPYTLSTYVRASSVGARFAMYIVFVNEAGNVITAPQLAETQVGTTFTRLSLTAVCPALATRIQVYPARLFNRSGAGADMWMEVDNTQFQEGAVLTAYSPSVQGTASDQAAMSVAVDSLSSTVSQQGKTLTSVSARTTTLENAISSTTDGLASKASASVLQTLGNRVTSVEGKVTTQSSDITNLKNSIGTAAPFVAGYAWEMTGSTRGWVANVSGATITAGPLYSTVSKYTQIQATNSFGNINGSENPYLRIRLRRRNTSRATAAMYWANEDGGLSEARRFNWPINLNTTDWQDIELDLSVHAGWIGKTAIYAIRLDMNIEQDPNAVIDIAYIAVGRRSAAGSAQALSALSSTVTQQGVDISSSSSRVTSLENSVNSTSNGLATKASTKSLNSLSSTVTSQSNTQTAQARSITQLQSTVGEHTSQISQLANSTADSNGKISATYSVKLAAAQNGLQYVAGFGLSLDNNSGVFQSQFVVAADRFAVIRDVAGNVTSPFVIDNGQVFIADAVIGTASITNAKIANGAITTAKIGVAEIDTLRIRGNAVTIPTSASTSVVSQGSGIGSWIGVIAVAVTMDQPGHIQVNFSCTQSFGHGIRDYGFRLLINGGVYASFSGTWADGFPGIAYSLPVDAGTYVMQVDWYGQDANVSIANKNLFAMGAKR